MSSKSPIQADLHHRHEVAFGKDFHRYSGNLLDLGGFSSGIHKVIKDRYFLDHRSVNSRYETPNHVPDVVADVREDLGFRSEYAIVSLIDVIEHISRCDRELVISQALKYGSERLIICCPFETAKNNSAERLLLNRIGEISTEPGAASSILEHQSLGLPRQEELIDILERHGLPWQMSYHTCRETLFASFYRQLAAVSLKERSGIVRESDIMLFERDSEMALEDAYRVRIEVSLR